MCVACVGLVILACWHSKFAGYDVRLSMLSMFDGIPVALPGARPETQLDHTALLENHNAVAVPSEGTRTSAVWALTSTLFFLCAFRSLVVWASTLEECTLADREVHDPVCFSCSIAMISPGFLTLGSLCRYCLAFQGCCSSVGVEGEPSRCCYALACTYLACPVTCMNLLGAFLGLKVVADLGNSSFADVFGLWRIPSWEEFLVLSAISALWLALGMISVILSACIRILGDSHNALCLIFFAFGDLMLETFFVLIMFKNNESFLPEVLTLASAVTTMSFACCSVGYILYTLCEFAGLGPFARLRAGHGYLWG
eukprot:TRINITY_DN47589_c0_g1_i1.p1 TRINITY_DN47589_c0_g1~~TRINITY_DN47589_c0_g1_i1.p1  ORF type:complete len:358 (-),score=45.38 TRINITY_DN47589_c0_g1_i1:208-1143(-)